VAPDFAGRWILNWRLLRRRLFAYALITAGAFLLASAAEQLFLMVAGNVTEGYIAYSVRAFGGSRGNIYRVYYGFYANRQEYEGSASAGAAHTPSGAVRVRYLPFYPKINGPADLGYLSLGLALRLLPGLFLPLPGIVLLRRK